MHGASLLSHVSSTGEMDVAVDLAVLHSLEQRVSSFIEAVEEAVRWLLAMLLGTPVGTAHRRSFRRRVYEAVVRRTQH